MNNRRHTAFVIPHTHWDREWYRPFRVFQLRLIDVIDTVLELLEDPGYRRFTLDGQAVILEDYLALRPEREEDLRRHVQEGRLRIGPWYVLADEFLVSPEALVRNLALGRRVCSRFGTPLPVGYTPDSFGHISQLPLLMNGFGLDSVVFQRGMGDDGERLGAEFIWEGADGTSEVFTAHLFGTYSGATALGHVSWEYLDDYDPERAKAHLNALLYGRSDAGLADLPDWFRLSLERISGGLTARATGGALVLMSGSDHLFPQPNIQQAVEDARSCFPEMDFVQADIEEYVAAARATAGHLERYRGELRGSRYQHILAGVLSARLYLKQANHEAELLLEKYAEPLSVLAWIAGADYPAAFLTEAWRELLKNHPHDSICGCSIDSVHREMMTRFETVMQMGQDINRRAFTALSGTLQLNVQDVIEVGAAGIAAFNPVPFPRRTVVRHELDLEPGSAANIRITDHNGQPVPFQVVAERVPAPGRSDAFVDRTRLEVLTGLPGLGFANLHLAEGQGSRVEGSVTLARDGGSLRLGNGIVNMHAHEDGSVILEDVRSRRRHDLQLKFEDRADAGDEYDFSPAAGDEPLFFSSPAGGPHLLQGGTVRQTVAFDYLLELPEKLLPDRRTRTGSTIVPARLELTLEADSPLLRIRITFDNTAQDHRLRLHLASGIQADTVWADGHWHVLNRPARPAGGDNWFQIPPAPNHQRSFTAVSDGDTGFALLNRGLPEYEALPGAGGTALAVTLVRSVGWLSRDDLLSRPQGAGPALETPEAQCQGPQVAELAVMLFTGDWWDSSLLAEAQAFQAPPAAFTGSTSSAEGLFTLVGPLVLSAVRKTEERSGFLIRIANPAPVAVSGELRFSSEPRELHRIRLDETRLEPLAAGSVLQLQLAPGSVETFEVVAGGGEERT